MRKARILLGAALMAAVLSSTGCGMVGALTGALMGDDTETSQAALPDTDAGKVTYGTLSFETTDFDGNTYTSEDLAEYNLVMINYWEPWCGPCVNEMPELEQLYQNYMDQGFLILGVYSTQDADQDVQDVLTDTGVTYPILHCNDALSAYESEYVPTTIFLDGEGNVLCEEQYIGAKDYDDWDQIVQAYLEITAE